MNTQQLFAEMPMLSIVTNFSTAGDFERVYLVVENNLNEKKQNQKKRLRSLVQPSAWNGPLQSYFREM